MVTGGLFLSKLGMKYSSKNDIPYLKFLEFSAAIEGKENDDAFVAYVVQKMFNPDSLEEFALALKTDKPFKQPFTIEYNFHKAHEFIDADTYLTDGDTLDLLKLLIKPKYVWQRINWNAITYAQAEFVINLFQRAKLILKRDLNTFTTRQPRSVQQI